MKRFIILCILTGGLYAVAHAATVTATWTNPTTNTDGSSIPSTGTGSLTQARIEYGTCNGALFGTKAGEVIRPMPVATATLNLNPGTTCIQVKVTNTYGSESSASNVVTKVVPAPVPSPPTNLQVSEPTAFNVRPDYGRFVFVKGPKAGVARLGASCDETRITADGYAVISRPRSAVVPRPAEGTVLVAKCRERAAA